MAKKGIDRPTRAYFSHESQLRAEAFLRRCAKQKIALHVRPLLLKHVEPIVGECPRARRTN